jgi:hypothetical protein
MPAGVSAWTPLANITLANSTTTSVTFGSISSAYKDLVIVYEGTSLSQYANRYFMNNDTGFTNYHYVAGYGSGSSVFASGATNSGYSISIDINSTTTRNIVTVEIFDYAQTDKHKTIIGRASNSGAGVAMQATRWLSTAAVSSVVITNAAAWSSGTTFSLYGISA